MVYLFNTHLNKKKKVTIALQSIYGIGKNLSHSICDQIGITDSIRIDQLSTKQVEKLTTCISYSLKIGAELKQEEKKNKTRLIKIGSYRGFRYTLGLPARGQRTHTNAQTSRKRKALFT